MHMERKKSESRCVVCGNAKKGLPIKEDNVIRSIRWFNRTVLKKFRNYSLVVCKDCYIKYKKARRSYVKKRAAYVSIGIVFTILLLLFSNGDLSAVLYGIVLIIFMYLLSLISYVPALRTPVKEEANHKKKA